MAFWAKPVQHFLSLHLFFSIFFPNLKTIKHTVFNLQVLQQISKGISLGQVLRCTLILSSFLPVNVDKPARSNGPPLADNVPVFRQTKDG
jgi:hypothetical protein